MNRRGNGSVLLLNPPWSVPWTPSLGVATLGPILRQQGFTVSDVHGMLHFPATDTPRSLWEYFGEYLFVPWAFPDSDKERSLDAIVRRLTHREAANFRDNPRGELSIEAIRGMARADVERAGECIRRIVDAVLESDPGAVGMSATFQIQIPGAIAIARRIKSLRPDLPIAIGGAACFGEQADGFMASFQALDAVCDTEGEAVVGPLFAALQGEGRLVDVPGIVFRQPDGTLCRTSPPPLVQEMDTLPVPDYDGFFAELEKSRWDRAAIKLFYETSRGCWWGDKHLCTFCGLNPVPTSYRRKSADRAYQEIVDLFERYPRATALHATDNILDMSYIQTVMPRLKSLAQRKERPLELFFEVKSNLRKDQVQTLADSGVRSLQPGIESFSDGVLALMNKGSTALQQVRFVKWATEFDIKPIYAILVANPGEKAAWYREMDALIPFIEHLAPPSAVGRMELARFSPYHSHPETYGITNIRPADRYRDIYPDPAVDVARIAYDFEYDHPFQQDDELWAEIHKVAQRATAWIRLWRRDLLFYAECEEGLLVSDIRGAAWRGDTVSGTAYRVFNYLDDRHTLQSVRRKFANVDSEVLDALLHTFEHRRWMCRQGDQLLVVIPKGQKSPEQRTVDVVSAQANDNDKVKDLVLEAGMTARAPALSG